MFFLVAENSLCCKQMFSGDIRFVTAYQLDGIPFVIVFVFEAVRNIHWITAVVCTCLPVEIVFGAVA